MVEEGTIVGCVSSSETIDSGMCPVTTNGSGIVDQFRSPLISGSPSAGDLKLRCLEMEE